MVATRRTPPQVPAGLKILEIVRGVGNRGGQDKSRKVRLVGWLENISTFNDATNIANLRHNFAFLRRRCSSLISDTLRGQDGPQ
jgi:hypothetical protein